MSNKLWDGLKKSKGCIEPAKRGDSIKPGVERSGTPGIVGVSKESPRSGRQPFITSNRTFGALSHASCAGFFHVLYPGGSASLYPRAGPQPSSSAGVLDFM